MRIEQPGSAGKPGARTIRPIPAKPHFFWQGVLILFPALLMAGFGLWSLRQDRFLAEHEAVEQAKKLAQTLAGKILPESLKNTPSSDEWKKVLAPGLTPIDRARGFSNLPAIVVCTLSKDGELIDPPPLGNFPAPAPFDLTGLSESAQQLWADATQSARSNSWRAAERKFALFLTNTASEALATAAKFQRALAIKNQKRSTEAAVAFGEIFSEDASASSRHVSEGGVPWKFYAGLQLLELSPARGLGSEKSRMTDEVCRELFLSRFPLAPFFLDHVRAANPDQGECVALWQKLWHAEELRRELFSIRATLSDEGLTHSSRGWIQSRAGRSFFFWEVRDETGERTLSFAPDDFLADKARAAMAGIVPEQMSAGVALSGRNVIGLSAHGERLAAATGPATEPFISVEVALTDPSRLYERVRARSRLFGALIGLAVAAVMAGFFGAWRAFHQQQRLSEMKSNFVSSVSHELRAPIASVRLMAEELEANPMASVKSDEYHHFIAQECGRLSALIENVLDFSRHERGCKDYEFEPTNLIELLEATVRLMRRFAAEKQLSIRVEQSGEPFEPEVDGRALQQVLVNLLDNAIKHSPPGNEIRVRVEFCADKFVLSVEDFGEGIAPEEQGKIFERFYRVGSELRRQTPGVGLGLAIVKYVAEAHRGAVTVRSELGQGSTFRVELPRCS